MPPARHRETQSVVAIQINQKDYTVTGLLRPVVLAKTPLHWIATSLRSSPTTTGLPRHLRGSQARNAAGVFPRNIGSESALFLNEGASPDRTT